MRRFNRHGLVVRFALISLVAFMAIGMALSAVIAQQLRRRGEENAKAHAIFVTNSILRYEFSAGELQAPIAPNTDRYHQLASFVVTRILKAQGNSQFNVDRVKVWARDGTIVFSDEPRLVGRRFQVDDDLVEAFDGRVVANVSNLDEPENLFEHPLASKLFATYVPLYLDPTGGTPVAVVEIYEDYAAIEAQVSNAFRTVAVTLLIGLGALYMLLLPIAMRTSATVSEQNERLEEQAHRLESHLQREQATVAELRELNRLKTNFVAVASHELRSPLTSIIGYLKTLQRPEFRDDERMRDEFLRATERQADRLLQLVQNLLATSQLEDQRLRLSIRPVWLSDVVADVVESLGGRGPRIQVDLAPGLPPLVTDRQHLTQILMNLTDNALKYSPNGQPCDLGARQQEDGRILIWVRDRGVGIPEDELARIFDRFYQVDSSSTRRFGGVGLGLSLVKDLVRTLGGTIEVSSEPGAGSTFTVSLPLRHPSVDGQEEPERGPGPHASSATAAF